VNNTVNNTMSNHIHDTALIYPGAEIDTGVEVGPYCVIGPDVRIGKGTKLHSHVVIQGYTTLGRENEIFPFACIGTAPQDLKYHNEPSTLEIGDKNRIRESVTIQPGTEHGLMKTIVGSSNLFMANSHIGHDCVVGDFNVIANSVGVAGHVSIEDHVIVGGMAGIHQFCRIGKLSLIGGGAMVAQDVPPFCIVQGDRATLRGLNLIGLKRAGFTLDEIAFMKRTYRQLFLQAGSVKDKIESLPSEICENNKVSHLLDFISKSKRGITLPSSKQSNDAEEIT
jgi:UDP-N-acetylglucosamine acyltransferase